MKYVWIFLASVMAIFLLIVFWPAFMDVWGTANTTYGSDATYDGLAAGVRFTPLLLWIGFLSIPIVAIIAVVWGRRKLGGG